MLLRCGKWGNARAHSRRASTLDFWLHASGPRTRKPGGHPLGRRSQLQADQAPQQLRQLLASHVFHDLRSGASQRPGGQAPRLPGRQVHATHTGALACLPRESAPMPAAPCHAPAQATVLDAGAGRSIRSQGGNTTAQHQGAQLPSAPACSEASPHPQSGPVPRPGPCPAARKLPARPARAGTGTGWRR